LLQNLQNYINARGTKGITLLILNNYNVGQAAHKKGVTL